MELLLSLLLVGLAVAAVAVTVLSIIAFVGASRVSTVESRVSRLESRFAALESSVRDLQRRIVEPTEEPVSPTVVAPALPPQPTAKAPAPVKAPPPEPPRPRKRKTASIDWERWIGIRGAAVLGALALGLAGLLLYQYSVEHGLISPAMRVAFGTLAGLASLIASEWLHKRRYRPAADGLAGAGATILYASLWAAHMLYQLIPQTVAFGLMALVTITCCLIAARRRSLIVALLGLVGGFATPLLLAGSQDRPIGLFGYVLLLDLGLLALGTRRRWPSLTVLSLLGTTLLQGLWVGTRMDAGQLPLALVVVALFGVLFMLVAARGDARNVATWNRFATVLFPFTFALYFAGRVELGQQLYPIALLLALLCGAACWLARNLKLDGLGIGAATAGLAVLATWRLQHALTAALAWQLVLTAIVLAAIFHAFVERQRQQPLARRNPALAAWISLGGLFLLLVQGATVESVSPWPWVVGWVVLVGLAYRQAALCDRGFLRIAAACGLGVGLSALHGARGAEVASPATMLALLIVAPVALHLAALGRRDAKPHRSAVTAAAALPVLLLLGLVVSEFPALWTPLPALGMTLLLGAFAAWAATRLGQGIWYAAAAGATLIAQLGWIATREGLRTDPSELVAALTVQLIGVVLLTAWPFVAARRFASERVAWIAAALVAPAWFLPLLLLFDWRFGDAWIGVVPLLLAAIALAAMLMVLKTTTLTAPVRKSALVWFAAAAACLVALAIPLQLEKQWITIGWALQGLALLALWKRLDHPGLKYFALALLAGATARLVINPALLGYYPRSAMRILNWLHYTYLVPTAALLGGAALLRPLEVVRAKAWERLLYRAGYPVIANGTAFAAAAVVFVWINLTVADWFATGRYLTLSFGDLPAQRLTLSIAWAVYALVLLGLGVARRSLALRWVSLGFLLMAIGKVFLYDLGALQDLYRVGSLVGLATSLILVSLAYQRFVFRTGAPRSP